MSVSTCFTVFDLGNFFQIMSKGYVAHRTVRYKYGTGLFFLTCDIGINIVDVVVYFFNMKNYFTV